MFQKHLSVILSNGGESASRWVCILLEVFCIRGDCIWGVCLQGGLLVEWGGLHPWGGMSASMGREVCIHGEGGLHLVGLPNPCTDI